MGVFTILHIWWFNLTNGCLPFSIFDGSTWPTRTFTKLSLMTNKDILNVCLMTNMDPRFFLKSSLWCNQTGDYPQDNIAKSGYRENMKVENLKNPFMFWLPAWTWHRYLVIFKFIVFEIWQIRAIFFRIFFYMCQIIFPRLKNRKKVACIHLKICLNSLCETRLCEGRLDFVVLII